MHRVARPDDGVAGIACGAKQRPQRVLHLVRTHAGDEREASGDAIRVERLADLKHELGACLGADLAPNRVADAPEELDVGPVELARALADPEHVGRAVVPTSGQRVLTCERLLVPEQQRFVARVHVDLVQRGGGLGVHPAGAHEAQRPIDLLGELFVALALGARRDEFLCPLVHAMEVCKPTLGESPKEVERGRRLVIRLNETIRVGGSCGLGGCCIVDDVATERRQHQVANLLERRRPGFGELTGDPPHLHDGNTKGVGEYDGHLEDDAQLLADVDR
ncbi:unannotated protein [freshwater metagenome]|uniref:Unannotated protein n=1 Tax=freshwater metagenome TaxID=449393 RepID=A0A6J7TUG8_9ZZZZ